LILILSGILPLLSLDITKEGKKKRRTRLAGKESERKRVEMEGGGREEAVEEESRKLKVERCKSVGRWTLVECSWMRPGGDGYVHSALTSREDECTVQYFLDGR
jgi:hypothetical protein